VFIPGLKDTSRAKLPDHHDQEVLPGRIQLVSAMRDSGLRLVTRLDSMSRYGSAAIMSTRQGDSAGASPITATSGRSTRGANRASMVRPRGRVRYSPAQFSRWASVIETHATPGASKVNGRATR